MSGKIRGVTGTGVAVLALALCGITAATAAGPAPAGRTASRVTGWLNWRGPQQNGTSTETGLPDTWALGGANDLWNISFSGGGTPVVAGAKLYAFGYQGQGPDLQEVLLCADANTGKKLWERRFSDFLSDIIYDRYAIGSPTVDPETGNVYVISAAGIFSCFSGDGKPLWQHSMMEDLGRLTFPNGRNGSPLIEDELVIVRGITSNWGADGPALDRFYAFDKRTGGLVWWSGPGAQPKDNSFAMPVIATQNGKRVLYTGDGSGHVVAINARTGQPLWRFPLSAGGINASVVLHKNAVIAIHADENLDSSDAGRQTAVKVDAEPKPAETGAPLLDQSAERWRNELETISSSPVLVGDRIYQVNKTGSLCCVDANTGKVLWRHKLGTDQLHASPTYADGKLYLPLQNGMFFIVRPGDSAATELAKVQLAGRCLGAPAVANGKIYVLTTEKLYCFGKKGNGAARPSPAASAPEMRPKPGKAVALQIIPAEVRLRPGEKARFTIRGIDATGFVTGSYDSSRAKWAKYIPPTARVRSEMNAEFNAQGELAASPATEPSAGAFEAEIEGLKGYIRGRILPGLPLKEDFEKFDLSVAHMTETDVKFAYPPLPWIGARFKWEVRDVGGTKALTKTLDNIFFQRATVFFGHPDTKNYTVEADVMSDGNRRTMSTVGLINQRYLISLLGNSQQLEVSSNQERVKAAVPFQWSPKEWYHLKTRVDVAADGSGMVRAKCWKKGETEPAAWTIEVPHKNAHAEGSPGIFGFAPQSLFRVYVDNVSVTANK
jgi:outer membrane protein assembly factor BamB